LCEHLDWNNPPGWAAEWDKNDLVHKADAPQRFAQDRISDYDFSKFAARLA